MIARTGRTEAKMETTLAIPTTGKRGLERIVFKSATLDAKYRDGAGFVQSVPTGCPRTADNDFSRVDERTRTADFLIHSQAL